MTSRRAKKEKEKNKTPARHEQEEQKKNGIKLRTTTRWNVKYLYILIYYFIDCN